MPVLSTEKRYTDMDYVELNVRVTDPELAEILTAELAELPYESFQTEGEVLKAYTTSRCSISSFKNEL